MSETETLELGDEVTREEALELLAPYKGKKGLFRKELGDYGEYLAWMACDRSPTRAMEFFGYTSAGNISSRWRRLGLIPEKYDPGRTIRDDAQDIEHAPIEDLAASAIEPAEDHASRAAYLERQNKALKTEVERLRETYAVVADIVRGQVEAFPPVKPSYKLPRTKTVDEELAMIHISDTHIGEWVLAEQTAGLETYNRDVFLERKERFQSAVSSIINGHVRKTWPVKHAYVHMYGDMATHENKYRGQAFRIDIQLEEQIVWGAFELADVVRFLCSMFETVTVHEMPGNHGDTEGTTLNTDWLLYYIMNAALRDQPNLRTILSDSPYLGYYIDESLGLLDYSKGGDRWNAVICHGQQARRYVGTPYYGLDRLRSRLINLFGIVWDTMRCGHHHEAGEGQGWELVPSWVGATDYSVGSFAAASRPQQLINGFHPRKGETWKFKLDLADKPAAQEPEEGNVYTPHNKFAGLAEA